MATVFEFYKGFSLYKKELYLTFELFIDVGHDACVLISINCSELQAIMLKLWNQ